MLLVLGATVLGARLAAAGDDRVEYWSVRSDATPGQPVSADDLRPAKVRLPAGAADDYLRTGDRFEAPLDDLVWAHELSPGSLVGHDALVERASLQRGELPLSVSGGAAPTDLAAGDRVDVWVGPGPGDQAAAQTQTQARRVLAGVRVLQSGGEAAAADGALARTVLVDVETSALAPDVITTVATGHVTLVRVA